MRLIALVGRAGSGKDTVGRFIKEASPRPWVLKSFAAPLKRFAQEVFAFTDEQVYGPSELRNLPDPRYPRPDGTFLTPREALQKLGTEWGRACYPDVWAEMAVRDALVSIELGHGVVLTDCRFINEAKRIRAAGGAVWRLYRDSADEVSASHPSETEMNSPQMESLVTRRILNECTLDELQRGVTKLLLHR